MAGGKAESGYARSSPPKPGEENSGGSPAARIEEGQVPKAATFHVPQVLAANREGGKGGNRIAGEARALMERAAALETFLLDDSVGVDANGDPTLDRIFDPAPLPELDDDAGVAVPKEEDGGEGKGGKGGGGGGLPLIWGGPVQPTEGDNLYDWVTAYFSGYTTSHGVNQSFDESNGLCRRIFWAALFGVSFVILMIMLETTFDDFWRAVLATGVDVSEGDNVLPMVTICNMAPVRCGCEAFYDESLLADDQLLQRVIPYVCKGQLGLTPDYKGAEDAAGVPIGYRDTLERDIRTVVDTAETKKRMAAFQDRLFCDNGPYTKEYIVNCIKQGTCTALDIFSYAGYHDRGKIVRYCKAPDAETGLSVSCTGDEYWGKVSWNDQYGACHTFNPCVGVPIGDECTKDSDCQGGVGAKGECVEEKCACKACKAGKDCKVISQLVPGKGKGARFVVNAAADQDPMFRQMRNSVFTAGAVVHLHTPLDEGDVSKGFAAPPGGITSVSVQQSRIDNTLAKFPFSECSTLARTSEGMCNANCVKRAQSLHCCGVDIDKPVLGRFAPIEAKDPTNNDVVLSSPLLLCNALNATLQTCFNKFSKDASEGTICLHGASSFKTQFYPNAKSIRGEPDEQGKIQSFYAAESDGDGDGVSDQEEAAVAMERHCVWRDQDGAAKEKLLGVACTTDADCPSRTGKANRQGTCAEAFRAYCPAKCDERRVSVASSTLDKFSLATTKLLAVEELALTTFESTKKEQKGARRWKPRCPAGTDTPDCFTVAEAEAYIESNYAMVQVDFETFDQEVTSGAEGVPLFTLLGTFGGNLGMFVGMSVMTLSEFIEFFVILAISLPFFLTGGRIKLPWIKSKPAEEGGGGDGGGDGEIEDMKERIGRAIKREAWKPKAGVKKRRSVTITLPSARTHRDAQASADVGIVTPGANEKTRSFISVVPSGGHTPYDAQASLDDGDWLIKDSQIPEGKEIRF